MPASAVAEGRRAFLRPLVAADRDAFLAAVRASRDLHRPWVEAPSTPAAFAAHLRRGRGEANELLVLVRRGTEDLLGAFNLSEIVRGAFRSAYLGYYAFVPHAGRGYMREGMRLLLGHAFGALGLHRVEANIQPGNEASRRLAAGAGFRLEGYSPRYLLVGGEWRDHERWAVTAEDPWAPGGR